MNWGHALFSFKGRLGPNQFFTGALVLMVITALLALAPLLDPALTALGLIAIVMWWCWIALWVKRLHDAGQSGWMFIIILIVYMIVNMILSPIITSMMGAPTPDMSGGIGNIGEFMELMNEIAVESAVPTAVSGFVISMAVVLVGNMVLKSNPDENQHGPATTGAGAGAASVNAPTKSDDASSGDSGDSTGSGGDGGGAGK